MPATAYAAPEHIQPPDLALDDLDTYEARCTEYYQQVREWAKSTSPSKSDLIGEIIRFPVADGCAQYVVMVTRPLNLIHLDDGDGYGIDDVTMRGLRVKDVQAMVERAQGCAQLPVFPLFLDPSGVRFDGVYG